MEGGFRSIGFSYDFRHYAGIARSNDYLDFGDIADLAHAKKSSSGVGDKGLVASRLSDATGERMDTRRSYNTNSGVATLEHHSAGARFENVAAPFFSGIRLQVSLIAITLAQRRHESYMSAAWHSIDSMAVPNRRSPEPASAHSRWHRSIRSHGSSYRSKPGIRVPVTDR